MATTGLQQEKDRFRSVLLREKRQIDQLLAALDGNGDRVMPLVEPPRRVKQRYLGRMDREIKNTHKEPRYVGEKPLKDLTLAEAARHILGNAGPLTTNELVDALTVRGKVPGGERPVATVYSTLVKAKGIKRVDKKWHKADDDKTTEKGKRRVKE